MDCTDELLSEFLQKHGYEALLKKSISSNKKRQAETKMEIAEEIEPQIVQNITEEIEPQIQSNEMVETEEEMVVRFDKEIRDALSTTAEKYKAEHMEEPVEMCIADSPIPVVYSEQTRSFASNLTEDEMILLLRSVMLRAKSGMVNAQEIAEKIRLLLLS